MAEKAARKSGGTRGRPSTPARGALAAALRDKVDAQSRRTAGQIRRLLRTRLPAALVEVAWHVYLDEARAHILHRYVGAASDIHVAIRTSGLQGAEAALKTLAHAVLKELAEAPVALPEIDLQEPLYTPPGPLSASPDLVSARTRHAKLQAQLIELRGRIVPLTQYRRERAVGGRP